MDRESAPDRLWAKVYWILQFLSFVGFIIGYFWIVGAFSSHHNGTDADHVSVVGGPAWDLGGIRVMIASGVTTSVLILLAWKVTGWPVIIGAIFLQGVLALAL